MEVTVRAMEPRDVSDAVALIIEGTLTPGVEDPRRGDDYWAAAVAARAAGGEVFVAESDDQVVGMCQVIVFRHFQHVGGLCAEVETVYVRSDLRSRGVGAAMMARVEEFARDRGCYRVQLTSRRPRVRAHRFYRRLGYEETSVGFKKSLVDGDLA